MMYFRLAITAACLLVIAPFALAIDLTKDGKSNYVIVVADDAIAPEQFAAKELADYVTQISGAVLPIVKESDLAGSDAPRVLVGQTKLTKQLVPDLKWESLGNDGVVLKTVGETLILAGGRPRGTLYAVDTFLEDHLGVRWWTSDESFVPHNPSISFAKFLTEYKPRLIYRESFNQDANDNGLFAARLKLNGHFDKIPSNLGGHYDILDWCHTSFKLIPPEKYFKDHPEWFALVGGKRQQSQLCLSNAAMRKELIKNALALVRKNPQAGIISISQADTTGPCECDECKKIVAEEGSQSGPWIRLVNEAAVEINKEYPNFLVETLAYWYTRTPPKLVKPSDHVLVRLCSIECDFSHPLSSANNAAFANDMDGWAKISPNLFVWNYVTNFANYLLPHPNMTPFDADLRWFVDHHVVGVFEQGDSANHKAGDMLPLRLWLLAHLLWNPQADQAKLRDEFLTGYYGPAAPSIAKYVDLINGVSKNPKLVVPCGEGIIPYITPEMVSEANRLFDEAAKSVADDPVISKRVRRERLAMGQVNLLRYDFAAALKAHPENPDVALADYKSKASAWIADCRELGVKNISEQQGFDSYALAFLNRGEEAIPPKIPAAGAKLPPGQFDLQDDQFKLFGSPTLSKIVKDAKASDGSAARMPGNIVDWAVQFHVKKEMPFAEDNAGGPWVAYIVVRVDAKAKFGQAFQYGFFDNPHGQMLAYLHAELAIAGDGEYHAYAIPVAKFTPGMYFFVAPLGNPDAVSNVYIDRIFLEKKPAK